MTNRVVFDIECVGEDFDTLDELSQYALLKNCDGDKACEAKEKEKLALWPVTGRVIAIGMYNPDTENAKVYYSGADGDEKEYMKDGVEYRMGSEAEVLTWFWEDMKYFDQVITFNGRGFDAPYIITRSMAHDIAPTKNLMPYRYDVREHCDLADQLSYYGSTRRFGLHMYAKALGIDTPKEDGVDGASVPRLFREKQYDVIAEYCMRDVYATAELYKKWKKAHKIK